MNTPAPNAATATIELSHYQQNTFVKRFGGLYEHSAWVAERAWVHFEGLSECSLAQMAAQLKHCVESASREEKLALICAHPDLVGKAAVSGELTDESTEEQASARLDQCSEEEFARFNQLNKSYKEKFGFPFVMAVRNSNRAEILSAFARRLNNGAEEEFRTALDNIHTIAWLRLQASELVA